MLACQQCGCSVIGGNKLSAGLSVDLWPVTGRSRHCAAAWAKQCARGEAGHLPRPGIAGRDAILPSVEGQSYRQRQKPHLAKPAHTTPSD